MFFAVPFPEEPIKPTQKKGLFPGPLRLLAAGPRRSNSPMGKYQLSRKDAKINGRFHAQLARKNAAEQVERAKQLKAQKQAKAATKQEPSA